MDNYYLYILFNMVLPGYMCSPLSVLHRLSALSPFSFFSLSSWSWTHVDAPPHEEEQIEVVWASDLDASWIPVGEGVLGLSIYYI